MHAQEAGWKIEQALALADRATLPQKWPPPPGMWPIRVNWPKRLNQSSRLFFVAERFTAEAVRQGIQEGKRRGVEIGGFGDRGVGGWGGGWWVMGR